MKWLLARLGRSNEKLPISSQLEDEAFFNTIVTLGSVHCNWKIRDETKKLVDQYFSSTLFIRLRDISGDGTTASKVLETTTNQTEARIELPVSNGLLMLELGYKTQGGEFITLEYQSLDFGIKKFQYLRYIDWFEQESSNIHQEMYERATVCYSLGGSEDIIA